MMTYLILTLIRIAGAVGEGLAVKFMAPSCCWNRCLTRRHFVGKVRNVKLKKFLHDSLSISLCYELKEYFVRKLKAGMRWQITFCFWWIISRTELIRAWVPVRLTNYELPFDASKLKNFWSLRDEIWQSILSQQWKAKISASFLYLALLINLMYNIHLNTKRIYYV
jgi:hypothetical protein